MKNIYLSIIVSFLGLLANAQNFTDTKGELQISNSGSATYSLPIALPPSIKNVAPVLNLTYSSGARGGIAGQGWSINSISSISRIATRRDIDGYVDGVDFDADDKLALDGQRLIVKTGAYWANGSTYETEFKSNTKIELKIEGSAYGPQTYFIVTSPDGSRTWYGSTGNGVIQNATSANAWYIIRFEDTYGNYITYNYINLISNFINHLYISDIKFSGNEYQGIAQVNKIAFNYRTAKRWERDYIKGGITYAARILDNVEVFTNNASFRKYKLFHTADESGYERVTQLIEYNGQGEAANPVVLEYSPTNNTTNRIVKDYTNNLDFSETELAGDFDGDGRLDFIANNQLYTNLFNGTTGNAPINTPFTGDKRQKFAVTTLNNNKLNQFQSVVFSNESSNAIEFKVYDFLSNQFSNTYNKTIAINNTGVGSGDGHCPFTTTYSKKSNEYLEGDFDGDGISEVLITAKIDEKRNTQLTSDNDCTSVEYSINFDTHTLKKIGFFHQPGSYWYDSNFNTLKRVVLEGTCKVVGYIVLDRYKELFDTEYKYRYYYFDNTVKENEISVNFPDSQNKYNARSTFALTDYEMYSWGTYLGVTKKCIDVFTDSGKEYFLVNLNPTSSTTLGSEGYVSLPTISQYLTGEKYTTDFNGDGKSDILNVNENGTYTLLGFKKLTVAPWIQLEILGQGTIDAYSKTKQILFGDYNGDGKADIMLPDTEGGSGHTLWNIYYSNPNPAGGEFFAKQNYPITEYWPATGNTYNTQMHFSNYYAIDINKDGKSDLVRVWRKYYKESWTINDHNTQWWITAFTNNIGNTTSLLEFPLTYDSDTENLNVWGQPSHFNSESPDIPIPITSNYRYKGANTELILIRGHYNKIEYYQFNKNLNNDNRLISVTEANGNIKHTIEYKPMQAADFGLGNPATDFYSSSNTATYPDLEFIRNPSSFLVSKLTATINGVSKSQDFKYRGLVSNFNYGAIGFNRTARSSWYISPADTKIWTIQNNDPALRGANTITWSNTNEGSVFAAVPDQLLSTKTNVFSTYTNPTTKIYNVLLDKRTSKEALSNITTESIYTYDGAVTSANYYALQTKCITNTYSGTTLQGTATIWTDATDFTHNPSGTGNAYYIGRPSKVNTSNTIYPGTPNTDTRTAEEKYSYTGYNLTKTEKKGHNTDYIVEEMTYDGVGNLLTKKVSAPTAIPAIASRTTTDEFEPTRRFVIKKTDHQGFVTDFVYNPIGQVTKSTNYLGVVSEFTFDNWGKLTQSKATNASLTPTVTTLTYIKLSDGGYTATSQNTIGDNAMSITQYDVLGRVVKSTTKGFAANTTISKSIVYDALGRKLKESEPYFSTASKWTWYEYDYLHRPIKVTASTGRIQTLVYAGLTTTSTDDGKVTTATSDAMGNKTQTTDPGGTVNFSYYASGQLKETEYEGHKVTIGIDGWGNKTSLLDPNAGTTPYTYTYDAFGQSKTETTPKGSTTYTYDDFGKLTHKKILGDGADFEIDYVYNAFAQLTSETGKKASGVLIDNYAYTFDNYHRVSTAAETNTSSGFTHTKTIAYDAFSRVASETNLTTDTASGLSSSVIAKNNYNAYNGIMDKMTDANDAVLWQLNTANEKMQSLTETLGNGIAIVNTYNSDNYFTSQKHSKNGINTLYNTYDFNAVKGNLNSRQNLALSVNETFTYDNLDRLTNWNNKEIKILECLFSIGTENFIAGTTTGTTTVLSNVSRTLKVNATGNNANTEKIIVTGAAIGKKIKIKVAATIETANTRIHIVVVERSPLNVRKETEVGLLTTNGLYEKDYTVTDYSEIRLKFYIDNVPTLYEKSASTQTKIIPPSGTTPAAVFYVDNLRVYDLLPNPQNYDNKGRITVNNLGNYNYNTDPTTGIYRKSTINLTPEGDAYYQSLPKQVVSYTMFKSPITINESDKGSTLFAYNSHLSRMKMDYGFQVGTPGTYSKTKCYTDDGSTEIIKADGTIKIRTYIGGDAYSAPLYTEKTLTISTGVITENKFYLHRDYQGTILAISDVSGIPVERRHFDAWGNLTKLEQNGVLIDSPSGNGGLVGLMMLDRGYTSHEHLAEVGLIHMNGRLYDPILRAFLMPDNFVQQPDNTQNYNRYAYVLNNPLKYTDPSGELFGLDDLVVAIIIGAVISAATYTITALLADVPFSVGGLCQATVIGAASAAVTFGIGSAATSMFTNFYSQAAFQAAAHATFQGSMTAANGGNFWSGFAAGAVSSMLSSAWSGGSTNSYYECVDRTFTTTHQGISGFLGAKSTFGMIAFGTLSGGAAAKLTGGNFWQGAATGLAVAGLNHALHEQPNPNHALAKRIATKYGLNQKEIYKWLNNHPLVVKDGVVSFEGAVSIDTNDPASANPAFVNESLDKASSFALKNRVGWAIGKIIAGGSMLLKDYGGNTEQPFPGPKGQTIFKIIKAENTLIDYLFRPQGPMQTPTMHNGYKTYTGYTRFNMYYSH